MCVRGEGEMEKERNVHVPHIYMCHMYFYGYCIPILRPYIACRLQKLQKLSCAILHTL